VRLCVLVCVAVMAGGCAGRRASAVVPDPARIEASADSQKSVAAKSSAAPPAYSLHTFMAKVRELSAQARPPRESAPTIETSDPELRDALTASLASPSPDTFRAVAAEYSRLHVFDKAHAYLTRAIAMAPRDSASYEALARLWRDAGLPELGLTDAHRAVYFAPESAPYRNTLGTILQALGHRGLARSAYEQALELQPSAAYALNNICYSWMLDGDTKKAVTTCQQAIALDPDMSAARNNLALAYAAAGDNVAARRAFATSGDSAAAIYNAGIVHLAKHEFQSAVKAFEAAHTLRPTLTQALARAKQAAVAAANVEE
jgi:Flp pilus assembly protein TadD